MEMASIGVDYGSVDENPPPDVAVARAAGLRWCYRRAAWGTWIDPHWQRDRAAFRAAGIVDGPYLFVRYDDQRKRPEEQVDALVRAVGSLAPTDLPPALDFECDRVRVGMTAEEIRDWSLRAWSRACERFGIAPVIYTSTRWLVEELDGLGAPELRESALWLAKPWQWRTHATAQIKGASALMPALVFHGRPIPWSNPWFFYQYQGDAIDFPGFRKTVDVNRFRVVRIGASGDHVRWIERQLGRIERGLFDEDLELGVRELQVANRIASDGVVGPATFAALAWNRPAR